MSHLISHHLFLSALAHEEGEGQANVLNPEDEVGLANSNSWEGSEDTVIAVPLEVLPGKKQLGDAATQWMRDHKPEILPPNW